MPQYDKKIRIPRTCSFLSSNWGMTNSYRLDGPNRGWGIVERVSNFVVNQAPRSKDSCTHCANSCIVLYLPTRKLSHSPDSKGGLPIPNPMQSSPPSIFLIFLQGPELCPPNSLFNKRTRQDSHDGPIGSPTLLFSPFIESMICFLCCIWRSCTFCPVVYFDYIDKAV